MRCLLIDGSEFLIWAMLENAGDLFSKTHQFVQFALNYETAQLTLLSNIRSSIAHVIDEQPV